MARNSSETIDVSVSRRILWIGGEAYPLQNIARVQSVSYEPRRNRVIARYIRTVIIWLVVAAVVSGSLSASGSAAGGTLVFLAILAIIAYKTYQMINLLSLKYYALKIETAGNPRTALLIKDRDFINKLVYLITDAINNPEAEFQFKVENLHVGDKIEQYGEQNVVSK